MTRTRRPQLGPPLIVPALAFTGLTIAGVIVGGRAPRPTAPAAETLAYVQAHAATLRLGAFLAFAAAVPLAVWAAVVYRRLRALGITAPGSAIALAGGTLAACLAAMSGLLTWVSSRTDEDAAIAAVLRDLSFALGGPGFVAFFGLLLAGVAVPMVLLGIRRPWGVFGLALAVVAELSTLTLLTMNAAVTLPIARFGGIVFLLAVSLLLPATRHQHTGATRKATS